MQLMREIRLDLSMRLYLEVDSVRYLTQQDVVRAESSGWETLLGAVVGGVVGNQFGGGTR